MVLLMKANIFNFEEYILYQDREDYLVKVSAFTQSLSSLPLL
jgi:hypothetical protein